MIELTYACKVCTPPYPCILRIQYPDYSNKEYWVAPHICPIASVNHVKWELVE